MVTNVHLGGFMLTVFRLTISKHPSEGPHNWLKIFFFGVDQGVKDLIAPRILHHFSRWLTPSPVMKSQLHCGNNVRVPGSGVFSLSSKDSPSLSHVSPILQASYWAGLTISHSAGHGFLTSDLPCCWLWLSSQGDYLPRPAWLPVLTSDLPCCWLLLSAKETTCPGLLGCQAVLRGPSWLHSIPAPSCPGSDCLGLVSAAFWPWAIRLQPTWPIQLHLPCPSPVSVGSIPLTSVSCPYLGELHPRQPSFGQLIQDDPSLANSFLTEWPWLGSEGGASAKMEDLVTSLFSVMQEEHGTQTLPI